VRLMLWGIRWLGGLGALGLVELEEILVVRQEVVGGRVEEGRSDSCERWSGLYDYHARCHLVVRSID